MSFPVWLTVKTCVACVVLHALISIPIALWSSRSRGLMSRAVSFIVTIPLVFPPIAMGFILLMLLGRRGPIGIPLEQYLGLRLVFSEAGVILAAFIAGVPLMVRPLQAAMERLEILHLEEAPRVHGCPPLMTILAVTVPQTWNTIISGFLLCVARASGEVGITMMLGGNISGRTNTLSLEIFNSVTRGEFDVAVRLCAILAGAGLILYVLMEKNRTKEL